MLSCSEKLCKKRARAREGFRLLFFFTRYRPLPYIARVTIAWLVFFARRPLQFESSESRSRGTLSKDIKQSSTFRLAKRQLFAGASQIYSIFITCKTALSRGGIGLPGANFLLFFLILEITNAATLPCAPWCLHN